MGIHTVSSSKSPKEYEELYWELVELTYAAIKGYERYLLNNISANQLAKIMKKIHEAMPDEDRDRRET